jgi:hypothetical protein
VGFLADKGAPGQVFSESFGIPRKFSFIKMIHTHHLSSGAGTIGQLLADVPSGLNLTPPQEILKKVFNDRFYVKAVDYILHI